MAHHCRSPQYINDRPRYILGRTIPEAMGLLVAAVLVYLTIHITGSMPFTGDAGKIHLLFIFIPPTASIVVSFVFYADGAEPYARQLVGYAVRRLRALPLRGHRLLIGLIEHARAGRLRLAVHGRPDEAVSS